MNCEQTQDRIVALLHHELSCSAERAVLEHTESCAACREELEQTRAISHAVRDLVPAEPSARERRRLQERILNATGGSLMGRAPSGTKALPPVPETRMLPGPNPTRLLGFAGSAVETTRSVSSHPPAETRATQPPESRRSSHRVVEVPRARAAAWAGLLCWVLLGLLVLAAGLLAAAYAPKNRPAGPASHPVPTNVQRTAEARWNERRLAKLHGKYAETFLTRGSLQLPEQMSDGTVRVLPHFVPVTGEMCLVLYREEDIARLDFGSPEHARRRERLITPQLAAAISRAPGAEVAGGSTQLPLELIEKFIGSENRATVLVFQDRIELWSSTRLEKYLATQPRFDLVGVDIQGVTGLPEALP